jgi:hypothetical protein
MFVGVDGTISEMLRLHCWPDPAGSADRHPSADAFSVHAHQAYGQSWILAGEILNRCYDVRPVPDQPSDMDSEALFTVQWDDSPEYDLGHNASSLRNTGQSVAVSLRSAAGFRPGQSYSVTAGSFHETLSGADGRGHAATLFYFDASQGWDSDAPVVGPGKLRVAPSFHRVVHAEAEFLQQLDDLVPGPHVGQ